MTAFEEEKGKHTHGEHLNILGHTINFCEQLLIII